jgi:hypothetical protein
VVSDQPHPCFDTHTQPLARLCRAHDGLDGMLKKSLQINMLKMIFGDVAFSLH